MLTILGTPSPIAISFGPLQVYWYGLCLVLAMMAVLALAWRLRRQAGLSADDVYDLALWLIMSGLLGARLYEVVVLNWSYYAADPAAIIRVWEGGLAIHGALIGGAVALIVWCRRRGKKIIPLVDLLALLLPLGQAIGRWGNYFNQELYGAPTQAPWAIMIEQSRRPSALIDQATYHPTFLYESLLNLVLFAILALAWRHWRGSGRVAALYLVGYGAIRFTMEYLRLDPTPLIAGFRLPQLVSMALVMAGLGYLSRYRTSTPEPS